ncbi:MAG TPA: Hint domain-containing protein [Nitrosopumilaceae archaeon]|nr:Hint domain-containing protein [Nitrosopumilaceae archaeon]
MGHPLEFWDSADIILDGTVISTHLNETDKLVQHDVRVEQYFKNPKPEKMITVYGPDTYNEDWFYPKFFKEGERALFYLKKIGDKYIILEQSRAATKECSPRDMIGLSTLPSEPVGRGGPTLLFDPYQTCNGYLYSVDYLSRTLKPLKQFEAGIKLEDIRCAEDRVMVVKIDDTPACVKPSSIQRLFDSGWAKPIDSTDGTEITPGPGETLVTLKEGQKEGSLLVQKIFQDSVSGLNFPEYPIATNSGLPLTLHLGDTASNGCTVEMTLVKISGNTAIFLKKEHNDRPCPICLSEDTVIDTPNGVINVKEVKEGMMIFTQDASGHRYIGTVLQAGKTMVPTDHKMVHIILDDKRELHVSPNHPTADGRLFGELLIGDTLDGSKIKNTELVLYNGTYTYDILPSDQTGFYWANGILIKSTLK